MKKYTLFVIAMLMLILTGCAPLSSAGAETNIDQGSYITGVQLNETAAGQSPNYFTILQQVDNTPVGVLLRGTTDGELYVVIKDEAGNIAWQSDPATGVVNMKATVTSLPAGTYTITAAWNGPLVGTYDLYMVPGAEVKVPTVSSLALLGGAGMILVAIGFVTYAILRRLGWAYLALGAGAWMVAVALKFLWAVPLNTPIYNFLTGSLQVPGEMIFHLYVGALTGVFEVLLVWLMARYSRLGRVEWQRALAFGIGFGAFEAFLLGLISLTTVSMAIYSPGMVPVASLNSLAQSSSLLHNLAPISERLFVILVHIFCNTLILYAATTRKPGYFWFAFVFKSLMDSAASYAQLHGLQTLGQIWLLEGIIAVFGIISWFGIRWLARRYPVQQSTPPVVQSVASTEP